MKQSNNILNAFIIALPLSLIPLSFQGCTAQLRVKSEPQSRTLANINIGLEGASLSVTESQEVYEFNFGKVDSSAEKYDDLNGTTVIDLLQPEKPLHPIHWRMKPNQAFILLLTNGALNPGALIEINDQFFFFDAYTKMSERYLKGDKNALPVLYAGRVSKLKIHVDYDAGTQSKIVKTRLDCVAVNRPGPKGEYRNGAATIQALPVGHKLFDPFTKAAAVKSNIPYELSFFVENHACN